MKIKDKKGKEIEIKNVKSQKAISTTPPSKWGTLTDFSEITPEEALTEDAVMPIVANGELKQLKYEDFKTSFEDLIIDRTNVIGYEKFDSIQDWTPVGTGEQTSPWVVNNGDYILGLPSLSGNVYINDDAIMIGDYFYLSSSKLSERGNFNINITGRKFIQTEYFTRENDVAYYESFDDKVENFLPVQLKFVKIKENLYFVEKIILQGALMQYVETLSGNTVPRQEYIDASSTSSPYDFSGKKAVQLGITPNSASEIFIRIDNGFQELTINLKRMGSKNDMKIYIESNADGFAFSGQTWLDSPRFEIYGESTANFSIHITKGATDSPGILTFYLRNKKLIAVK